MNRRVFFLTGLALILFTVFPLATMGADPAAVPLGQGAKPLKDLFNQAAPEASPETGAKSAPVFPGDEWEAWPDPASRGWIPAGLAAAERHFHTLGATGLMIVDQGRVVAQWGDTARPVNCHSVRKSLISALYGIEAARGTIDLNATLADLDIDDKGGLSPDEKRARVRELLMARSGVYHPAAYENKAMRKKRPERGSHAPGEFWYYNNWDFNALGTIFRQETGKDIFQAFYEDIATPIGMRDFHPEDGIYHKEKVSDHPAFLFHMSVRDRARFGLLYLNQGRWKDRQVIPKKWVEESTTPLSKAGKGIGYGYLWWVSTGSYHLTNKVQGRAYSARGYWGQYIVVLPGHELVVAMATDKSARAPRISTKQFGGLLKMILRSNQKYLATLN